MKANDLESKKFDKALDDLINLFNDIEDDEPVVNFDDDLMEQIEIAKKMYGSSVIDTRINNVVREMMSLLPLDKYEEPEENVEE